MFSPILVLSLSFALAQNAPVAPPAVKSPTPAAPVATAAPSAAKRVPTAPESSTGVIMGANGLPKILPRTGPCVEVSLKFCEGKRLANGELNKCLTEHKKDLPPACIQRLEYLETQRKATPQKCLDETQKLCGQLKAGEDYIGCLNVNAAKFSAFCRKQSEDYKTQYSLEHAKGAKKMPPPKIPTKIMTDPALVKPPPAPAQEPPPKGYVSPPPKNKNGAAKAAAVKGPAKGQTPVPAASSAPTGP